MRNPTTKLLLSAAWLVGACGGGDDADDGDLFEPKPECSGAAVTAFAGKQPQVISKLAIGSKEDGFDLDRDGEPDNKLAAVANLAAGAIADALAAYEIIIPMEFFDLDAAAADDCVKFAVYLGDLVHDGDGDGAEPFVEGGDCNDNDPAIYRGAPEIVGNYKDDDCDGLADEDDANVPSTDDVDRDGDGQTIAEGDCDDEDPTVMRGAVEICGDGRDNDCDGVADRTGGETSTACNPFDPASQLEIPLDPLSFAAGGTAPAIAFKDGTIVMRNGVALLQAGPSLFSVSVPVFEGVSLDLRITGARIEGEVTQVGDSLVLKKGRLGGVIDAISADNIRGLEVEDIGLKPENSLLDATFANLLGTLLALPRASRAVDMKYPGCRTPDIDVDRDGLEAFCDSNLNDDVKTVDVCIDGDGTEVMDVLDGAGEVVMHCTEAMKDNKRRFVDGISVELNFETSPIKAIQPPR